MKLEIGKTYLTKHGRFAIIDMEPWVGVFNGNYEDDGRHLGFGNDCDRWKSDEKCWNFIFLGREFFIPGHDIIMEDCEKAREIALGMKHERKIKAYNETQ